MPPNSTLPPSSISNSESHPQFCSRAPSVTSLSPCPFLRFLYRFWQQCSAFLLPVDVLSHLQSYLLTPTTLALLDIWSPQCPNTSKTLSIQILQWSQMTGTQNFQSAIILPKQQKGGQKSEMKNPPNKDRQIPTLRIITI